MHFMDFLAIEMLPVFYTLFSLQSVGLVNYVTFNPPSVLNEYKSGSATKQQHCPQ